MRILSLVVIIGAAFGIPAPRQLFSHGPITREVLDTRGTSWDNVVGELPPTEGDGMESSNKFRARANDLMEYILKRKHEETILLRSAGSPLSQDPYGTGRRLDKDSVVILRSPKPPTRSGTLSLPPHDGRAVDIRSQKVSHKGKRGGGPELPRARQEEPVEVTTWKGQNKNWKGRRTDWLKIGGPDVSSTIIRGENTAGDIKMEARGQDWGKISIPGTEAAAVRDTKRSKRQDWLEERVQQDGLAEETDWH